MKALILVTGLLLDNGSVVNKYEPLTSITFSSGNMVVNGVKRDNFTYSNGRAVVTYRSIYASGFE